MHAVKEILTGKPYTCLVEKQKSLKGFVSRTIKTSKTTNNILLIDMFLHCKTARHNGQGTPRTHIEIKQIKERMRLTSCQDIPSSATKS